MRVTQYQIITFIVTFAIISTTTVQGQFKYITNNDNAITITGYVDPGPAGDVTIPSTISGLPVTTIGFAAINSSFALSSVTNIEHWAFYRCLGLTNVTLHEGVMTIGDTAFEMCISLPTVKIPSSVRNIGYAPFRDCTNLVAIGVEPQNPAYCSVDGVLFNKDQTTLVQYPGGREAGDYTIGSGVTVLGYLSFAGSVNLTTVTVGDGVQSIVDATFYECPRLSRVLVGVGVTNIGMWAFQDCASLSRIYVAPQNAAYRSVEGVLFNKHGMALILHPQGRTGVYTMPKGVTSIEDYAFFLSVGLDSILIPFGVTNIGHLAFAHCKSLPQVTLPDSVRTIGRNAFWDCTNLADLVLSKSLRVIPSGAFAQCSRLAKVIIPDTVSDIEEGETYWGAFSGCSSLTDLTIPNGVTNIGRLAFSGCTGLTNVSIGSGVTRIGSGAFGVCSKLTSVRIPVSVTSIGPSAFSWCTSLTSISIPENVTSIGEWTFAYCSGLTNVIIGSGVTNIDLEPFYACDSLVGVYFEGNAPTASTIFTGWTNTTVYYLPGTVGWGSTLDGRPTAPWLLPNPRILTTGVTLGLQTNSFAFRISWATNASVVVEASTDPANSTWLPVGTNALVNGWSDFRDAKWTNYPARFYRIRSL